MEKRLIFSALVAWCMALSACAQGPNNSKTYYAAADGLSGAELKTALGKIIKSSQKVKGYSSLDEQYQKTDKKVNGELRDWYDNSTHYNWSSGGWNKEHLMPQSWFKEASPMKSDIVHVVPTDINMNSARGSLPLAEVGSKASDCKATYSIWGTCKTPGYSGKVFEPNDEIKGDVARVYFYMATCYEDLILDWKGRSTASTAYAVIDHSGGSKYQPYKQWYMDMLLRWAKEDPVDEVEIARNNGVYQVQANRNPFVDYPGLEDYIWGEKADMPFSYDNYDNGTVVVFKPAFQEERSSDGLTVTVALTTKTEGADIYYTLDGQTPTTQSTLYTAPIVLTETTTVKAIAATAEGQSAVAEQTFTITQGGNANPPSPAAEGIFVRVSSTSQLVSGAQYLLVNEDSGKALVGVSNNRGTTGSVSTSGGQIDLSDASNHATALTLEKDASGNWTMRYGTNYVAHTAKSNSIATSTQATDAQAQWSISVSGGDASITNKSTGYFVQYNKSADIFRCYGNAQQAVQLYMNTSSTGISRQTATAGSKWPVYTLDGRKVSHRGSTRKGIYVKNGRKYLVK